MRNAKPPAAPVPHGRLTRLLHLGGLVAGVTGGMVAEGVRRLSHGTLPSARELLLSAGSGARVAESLSRLRGAAMKVGQLLSMEAGSVLPPEFTQMLARLRADAHPMPASQLALTLGRAWGRGWEQRFRRFSLTPLAAASIGQVHAAQTRDGRALAIKVQYPGVRDSIDGDVDNVATLLRISRLLPEGVELGPLLAEAKRQLHAEADYLKEAAHLEHYARLLRGDPDFILPRVDPELTTAQVLAMTFLPGEPLESLAGAERALRDRVATRLLSLLFRELFEIGLVQTDPNLANYAFQSGQGRLVLLDFGATRAYPRSRSEAYRRLLAAVARGDRAQVAHAARDIGYLGEGDAAHQQEAVADLILAASEPVRHPGAYDFGSSDLPARVRDLGLALSFEHGFWRVPPPDTAFLHRKFVGTFLLCARLGARVDVGALLAPYIREPDLNGALRQWVPP